MLPVTELVNCISVLKKKSYATLSLPYLVVPVGSERELVGKDTLGAGGKDITVGVEGKMH